MLIELFSLLYSLEPVLLFTFAFTFCYLHLHEKCPLHLEFQFYRHKSIHNTDFKELSLHICNYICFLIYKIVFVLFFTLFFSCFLASLKRDSFCFIKLLKKTQQE